MRYRWFWFSVLVGILMLRVFHDVPFYWLCVLLVGFALCRPNDYNTTSCRFPPSSLPVDYLSFCHTTRSFLWCCFSLCCGRFNVVSVVLRTTYVAHHFVLPLLCLGARALTMPLPSLFILFWGVKGVRRGGAWVSGVVFVDVVSGIYYYDTV